MLRSSSIVVIEVTTLMISTSPAILAMNQFRALSPIQAVSTATAMS